MPENKHMTTFDKSNVGSLFDTVLRDTLNDTQAALTQALGQLALTEQRLRDLVEAIDSHIPKLSDIEFMEIAHAYGAELVAARKHLDREIASEGQGA